jgi:RNA polymerase sigma-70 factor (ECF subfamily)
MVGIVRNVRSMLDAGVLDAFRRGEGDAVRALYREYGRLAFSVALRTLGHRDLAEEATQQTFVQAWRAADRLDPGRDPGPWLATIARRAAIDIFRREQRRATETLSDLAPDDPAVTTLPPDIDRWHDRWQVRRAIDELVEDEREVVRLQHLEGLTHAEIAERLGVPVGTVKSRSHRAHRRLAASLAHLREAS